MKSGNLLYSEHVDPTVHKKGIRGCVHGSAGRVHAADFFSKSIRAATHKRAGDGAAVPGSFVFFLPSG